MSFLPVAQAYDRWSGFYDTYENPMVWMAEEIVRRSVTPHVADTTVFEFGCGTGRNLAALRDAGAASVAGCDLSPGMLQVAREKRALSGVVFEHDMRQRIPHIADGSIDLVLFCLSLEHVEELQAPIDEALRIVRPRGGRIAIVEIHPFLSFSGVAAHFDDGDNEVRMPAFPHPFAAYLNAFAARNLRVTCREWRPRDIGNPPQLQGLKRGPDFPLSVEFSICL